jgi:pimeloyl-ACP methyl ester carboxylesterase
MFADAILVHGKFHGPWCWDPVITKLDPAIQVYAPELPSQSLSDDAALVRQIINKCRQDGRRVVVVGHSYAGMVILAAGSDACHLVYLAALVPDPGQTNAQASAESTTEIREGTIVVDDGGRTVSLRGPRVADVFYNRCTKE